MVKLLHGWRLRVALAATMVVGAFAGAPSAHLVPTYDATLGGPSVLLPYENGASPFTGIGRYEGRLACTAVFIAAMPGVEAEAPAYAVTNGHCAAVAGANDVLTGRPGVGRVIFNYFAESQHYQVAVPVASVAYASMKGRDLAVLELATSYQELGRRLIRPRAVASSSRLAPGDLVAVVGAPLWSDRSQAFLRLASCRFDGVAPVVLEHMWHWFDVQFNRCRDVLPGSSGSAVISIVDRVVVGLINTHASGATGSSACGAGDPCELGADGVAHRRANANYVTPIVGIMACFDGRGRFSVEEPNCPLDPGTEMQATPAYIGSVNPVHESQPMDPVRRTWNVAVAGREPRYRYALVTSPDECRLAAMYSNTLTVATAPVIDRPLPVKEGFAFLCVTGAAHDGQDVVPYPTVVAARVDMTAPRLGPYLVIEKTAAAWRVAFATAGPEVSFHVFKVGPPSTTRCEDPAGYRLALEPSVGLPKANAPYRFCAIPYDAAQNPGAVFERVLS